MVSIHLVRSERVNQELSEFHSKNVCTRPDAVFFLLLKLQREGCFHEKCLSTPSASFKSNTLLCLVWYSLFRLTYCYICYDMFFSSFYMMIMMFDNGNEHG